MEKIVAIPVETKVRELDGKLFLACQLVDMGFKVAFGPMREINARIGSIDPHIYIGDSAVYRPYRDWLYTFLQKRGSMVMVLDTEGGVFISPQVYLKRLSEEILARVKLLFTWGKAAQELILSEKLFPEDKVIVSGNPSFDFTGNALRSYYSPEVAELKNQYGDYILINTNFSLVNHFNNEILQQVRLTNHNPERVEHMTGLLESFVDLMRNIAQKFPDLSLILRPHPSENHQNYRELLASHKNIYVVHEGVVHPWILASKLVIHNSCTTGIESALLARKVIAYRPLKNDNFDLKLPNAVSIEVSTEERVMEFISEVLESKETDAEMDEDKKDLLQHYISNVYQVSSQIIGRVLCELPEEEYKERQKQRLLTRRWKDIKHRLYFQWTKIKAKLNPSGPEAYDRQKFPYLKRSELRDRIAKIRKLTDSGEVQMNRIGGTTASFWLFGKK